MKIWVTSLADYNNGQGLAFGKWFDIEGVTSGDEIDDMITEFLEKRTKDSGELHEEWAVHDYELPCKLDSEWPDFNELADTLVAIEEHGEDVVCSAIRCDIPIEKIPDAYHGCYKNPEDYAYEFLHSTDGVPDHLEYYIDYESYARDLEQDFNFDRVGYEECHVWSNHY